MHDASTICAIATAPGTGGVGIVRLSGPDAEPILRSLCPSLPTTLRSHHLRLTTVVHPHSHEALDEVLVTLMRAPASYTGEDVAEIHGHGGRLNMKRLLQAALDAGATAAAPGEFTQRAFIHGRLDLTQAEAVADMIHAQSDAALRLARQHLAGTLGNAIDALRESLIEAIILTESAIDFSTEEHVYQLDTEALGARITALLGRMDALLGTWDAGRQARDGVRVALVGRPNAGKSTLFNALCGEARAIVTDIPGTTRDYLEEQVLVHGVALRLIDTAGLRDAEDAIEKIGVERSRQQAALADIILWVMDASAPLALPDMERAALTAEGVDVLPILNKADLPEGLSTQDLEQIKTLTSHQPQRVSLLGESTPEALVEALAALAAARLEGAQSGAVLTRARHREAMIKARDALLKAQEAAQMELSHEFLALDLRLALEALGAILGKVSTDDLLARIFSEFCVGK